ncbi:IS5 family transposase [Sphingopyxis sp. SE2]|uniref:IS5 family transposase n=1 Tax=Sphingopyxis macrogoltabida TaxID=33050 RepID=A0A2W5KY77_SPHMC|nr:MULTISPECIES: IS5 family transposase [unclassified Sphingopyxis]MDT7530054.1 IS5 family transposase [Sphingopyxis sp. SE2]PZQ20378.1 MAG: IS5 family transposase [Sphingopyxis macrogoltabida]
MRGADSRSGELFSYVDLEQRVPASHPLRLIRGIVNEALGVLSSDFSELYSGMGRPSISPEMLLRAMLLQAFYSVRSERQLMERIEFDLLFRWFVGLGIDEPVWDHSTFSKNRERLLAGDVAAKFLCAILDQARVRKLLSRDHFSVDGTLVEAWASMKSFRPRDDEGDGGNDAGGRNAPADFRGEKRSNATHASRTDPDAMLYKKGPGMEAKLCFIGHGLMENRSGLIVDARLTRVSGHAERLAALEMIEPHADRPGAITLGADRGYDAADFVEELREINVRPHVARNTNGRRSAIDRRTTRHAGYAASQRIRKRIEEAFGWIKTVAGLRKTKLRGLAKVDWAFTFAAAAYNLVRLPKLLEAPP